MIQETIVSLFGYSKYLDNWVQVTKDTCVLYEYLCSSNINSSCLYSWLVCYEVRYVMHIHDAA